MMRSALSLTFAFLFPSRFTRYSSICRHASTDVSVIFAISPYMYPGVGESSLDVARWSNPLSITADTIHSTARVCRPTVQSPRGGRMGGDRSRALRHTTRGPGATKAECGHLTPSKIFGGLLIVQTSEAVFSMTGLVFRG